jgi:hypothetical protein
MAWQALVNFGKAGCSLCNAAAHQSRPTVVILSSVGRRGRNEPSQVKNIQTALNGFDPADGGPVAKLAVDGVAGADLIAAIEKFQMRWLGSSDGLISPGGQTMIALNGFPGGVTQPPPKATPEQNTAFIERIGKLLPRARHWIETAQLKIDMAAEFLQKGKVDPHDAYPALHDIGKPDLALFDKYFHTEKLATATRIHQLRGVQRLFDSMRTVITDSLLNAPVVGWGVGYFQPDPNDGTLAANAYEAYTFPGGWQARRRDGTPRLTADDNYSGRKDLRQDTIFFPVGHLLTRSDNYMTATIIHELTHFVGPGLASSDRILDYTWVGKSDFLTVNNWHALHSAATYSYFAAESGLRRIAIPLD